MIGGRHTSGLTGERSRRLLDGFMLEEVEEMAVEMGCFVVYGGFGVRRAQGGS